MRLVVAVEVDEGSWRIHVEIPSGQSDVFRDAACVGSARYRPGTGWIEIDPDTAVMRAALAAAVPELLPFAEAMRGPDA